MSAQIPLSIQSPRWILPRCHRSRSTPFGTSLLGDKGCTDGVYPDRGHYGNKKRSESSKAIAGEKYDIYQRHLSRVFKLHKRHLSSHKMSKTT